MSPYVGYNTGSDDFNQAILYSLNHVFTPNIVFSGKVAYNRLNGAQPLGTAGIVPGAYLNEANTASSDASGLQIALPGYPPFSPGNAIPFGGPQNFYQFQPDLSWTKGPHSLHFGGTYVQLRDNRTFGAYENATQQIAKNGTDETTALLALQAGTAYQFNVAIYPQGKYPCYNDVNTGNQIQTPACTINLPVGPQLYS